MSHAFDLDKYDDVRFALPTLTYIDTKNAFPNAYSFTSSKAPAMKTSEVVQLIVSALLTLVLAFGAYIFNDLKSDVSDMKSDIKTGVQHFDDFRVKVTDDLGKIQASIDKQNQKLDDFVKFNK